MKRQAFLILSFCLVSLMIIGCGEDEELQQPTWIDHVKQHVRFDGPGTFETWTLKDFEVATLFDSWHNVYTNDNGQPLKRVGKWYWEDRAAFKGEDRGGKDDSPLRLVALKMSQMFGRR